MVMRKVCIRYADLHPLREAVREAFIGARTSEDVDEVIRRFYDPDVSWPPVPRRGGVDRVAAGALEE
jgi:hypothetical protein